MKSILNLKKALNSVVRAYSLDEINPPVDLEALASSWGVLSISNEDISSDAMLIPSPSGYRVLLRKASTAGERIRQRFSLAHELAHLLLKKLGYDKDPNSIPIHSGRSGSRDEERLCDKLAVEILMPRSAFISDASEEGWNLEGIRQLTRRYNTSVQATASRLISLAPEPCHMAIWQPPTSDFEMPRLQHSLGKIAKYGIQRPTTIPRRRLWLITRAANSVAVESGCSPLSDRARPMAIPRDVPAEAWAWGNGQHRRVLVIYYPERQLTDDMKAVANATRRLF